MVSSILLDLGINNLYDMTWTKIDQKMHDIGNITNIIWPSHLAFRRLNRGYALATKRLSQVKGTERSVGRDGPWVETVCADVISSSSCGGV